MKTPHMRKLGKQLSRNTGEVLIGTERDFSRRSGASRFWILHGQTKTQRDRRTLN